MKGAITIYRLLIAEAVKQMKLRHLNQRELAEAIKFPYQSVRLFMCEKYDSEPIANAIANYLGIQI